MKPEKRHQMQYNYSSLPLHKGSLKILTGRGLMSVLILYKNTLCKETLGQSTLSSDQYLKQSSVPTCNLYIRGIV